MEDCMYMMVLLNLWYGVISHEETIRFVVVMIIVYIDSDKMNK